MAACLLRRLVTPQVLRSVSVRSASFQLTNVQNRNIHVNRTSYQKYFTDKHEWIDVPEGSDIGTVGITEYAQDKLGDVVYIQPPEVGEELEPDGFAGVLESVKAASEIYSPITGTVTEANATLENEPSKVNTSPYDDGWVYKMTVAKPEELEGLMSQEGYEEYVATLE